MNRNSTPVTDDVLARFLLGEASINECEAIERWAAAGPLNRKKLNDYKKLIDHTRLEIESDSDEHQALQRLNQRLKPDGIKRKLMLSRITWAAILLLSVGGWLSYSHLMVQKLLLKSADHTLRQVLPDGSEAILNRQSALIFKGGLWRKTRNIQLQGEAFFSVKKDPSKPFIIEANKVVITVAGTAFLVKTDSLATTVIVEEGKVKVATATDSLFLLKGEKVEVLRNSSALLKQKNLGKLYNYYYTNELVCNGTPLHELVDVLNKKFRTPVHIKNKALWSLPITVTFKDESLDQILTVVAETLKINVIRREGIIELY